LNLFIETVRLFELDFMKAMILAAGLGTRLKELTKTIPKCLVPLANGSTMLERVILQLKAAGVTDIIINLHYLPEQIKKYISDKNSFGLRIEFSYEDSILGTGGGLKNAKQFFDDGKPFFLHNSDVWSDVKLTDVYQKHLYENPIATLAVTARETKRQLFFDESLKLIPKLNQEDQQGGNPYGFSGIQVLSFSIFDFLEAYTGEFSTIPVFFSAVSAGSTVQGFDMSSSYWIDMGSPEKLAALNQYIKQNNL
jgi:MurNAc alpha-1-phosphate uridylyltransferase